MYVYASLLIEQRGTDKRRSDVLCSTFVFFAANVSTWNIIVQLLYFVHQCTCVCVCNHTVSYPLLYNIYIYIYAHCSTCIFLKKKNNFYTLNVLTVYDFRLDKSRRRIINYVICAWSRLIQIFHKIPYFTYLIVIP